MCTATDDDASDATWKNLPDCNPTVEGFALTGADGGMVCAACASAIDDFFQCDWCRGCFCEDCLTSWRMHDMAPTLCEDCGEAYHDRMYG